MAVAEVVVQVPALPLKQGEGQPPPQVTGGDRLGQFPLALVSPSCPLGIQGLPPDA